MDYIDEILKIWCEEYKNYRSEEYIITNLGKDRSGIGKLQKLMKKKNPNLSSEEMKKQFRKFFAQCLQIEEDFYYEGMSPAFINSQLNRIKLKLKKKIEILSHDQLSAKERTYGISVWTHYQIIDVNGNPMYVNKKDFDPKIHKKWTQKQTQQHYKVTGQYKDGKKVTNSDFSITKYFDELNKKS